MAQKRILKSGKIRWIGRYRDAGGKEHPQSFDTEREAKAYERDNKAKVSTGTWVDPSIAAKITLLQLAETWRDQGPRDGTRKDRQQLIGHLVEISHLPIGAITEDHLNDWVIKLREGRPWAGDKPLAESNVRNRVSQLRSLFNEAHHRGYIVRNPSRTFRSQPVSKAEVKPKEVPTDEDIDKLIAAAMTGGTYLWKDKQERVPASPWLVDAMITSQTTGIRSGEVGGFWVDDVNWAAGDLNVSRQAGTRHDTTRPLKSDSSERIVPVPDSTMAMWRQRALGREGKQVVLYNNRGSGLTAIAISARFVEIRRLAGVREDISFHGMRHYYATHLIAANVPLTTVQKLLGHASLEVTARIYAHFLPGQEELARDAAEAFSRGAREPRGNFGDDNTLNVRAAAGQDTNVVQFRPRSKR